MDRCPNCRARYEGDSPCRRCGMDLSSLLAVERAVEGLIAEAMAQLARGEVPAARQTLSKASTLHSTPLIGRLLGFLRHIDTGD